MNNPRLFPILVFCCILMQMGYAQQYFSKSYTIENGLPTRIVNDACQDSSGIMWFATYNGISSYDGFCFTNYNKNHGLPDHHFRKVKFDQEGVLWGIPYGISDTVVCFQKGRWTKIHPASNKPHVEVSAFDLFTLNGNTVICIGSAEGLDILKDGHWNHVDVSKEPSQNLVFSVLSKDGKFFVLTKTGVWILDQDKSGWGLKEFYRSAGEPILAIQVQNQGSTDEKFWLLDANRLVYLQDGKLNTFNDDIHFANLNSLGKSFLNFDHQGNIYFGSNLGKYFIRSTGGKAFPLLVSNGFSSNGATSLFVDREDNLWFMDTRGVDKINNLMVLNYYSNNGLLEDEVTAIVELAGGGMVFGHNKGLTIFDGQKFTRFAFSAPENIQARVMDIFQDHLGNLWFAASSLGFGKMLAHGKIKWYPVDSNSLAVSIREDSQGRIWMGTSQELCFLKNDKIVTYEHNDGVAMPFRKIFSSGKDEIIGVGLYGVYSISEKGVREISVPGDGKSMSFYSYYQSNSGVVYIGALDGLFTLENGVLRKFHQNGISIDCPVYFIFQDHDQNFWIGSNNGLIKWDGKTRLETFTIQNGLAGRETNRSAGLVDSHGNVWVGTDKGLSCFLQGFSGFITRLPVVKLLNIEDNMGKNHSLIGNSFFRFNENTLVFHFRGISFVNEELISYRYKLDGFDQEWQFIDQSDLDKIKYSGLGPGKYRFMVQARNASGNWSELAKSGVITIYRPFYSAWWFILAMLILISTFIFGVYKLILQRKYNQKLEKEISERKRSEEKTVLTLKSLHASEMKYRELIEFAVDGFLMGAKDGTITGANSYMQNLTGLDAENLIGKNVQQLFSTDNLDERPLRYDLLERGEIVVSHRSIIQPDGTLIPVEMHTKMMPDGSYQSIYHDISKRKQAEQQLRESRELYKLITDKMTDVVWLMDLKGRSTFVSPSIEQFTGFSVSDYLQQTIENRFTPDSVALVKRLFASELPRLTAHQESLRGYSYTLRLEYYCKNGRTKWGELLMTPFFGSDGAWIGIHGVTRDITERKVGEEALKEKARELERFNSLMVGRELRMIELKKEINELLVKLNKPEKYTIHEL